MESGEWRVESRVFVRWAWGLVCGLVLTPVWAHENAEELGHHWEVPGYLGEVRLQLAAMAVLTCVIVAGMLLSRVRRNRRAHR